MNISIASYAFHGLLRAGQMDVFGYLESCKYRYGLQTADIWNGMLPTTDEDYVRKVRAALDEHELTLVNLCVDGAHIWEDDPAAREKNYQNALAHLRAAVILGAKTVRIDAGSRAPAFTPEQFDLVIARYQEYARFAADHGFRVGPENHWGPERTPATMLKILQTVDSPAMGLLLHVNGWDEPGALVGDEMVARYAMHTHLAWDICEGPLETKMALLRASGYQGCWGVEFHAAVNEYAQVAVQVARVRSVLEKWRTA